MNEFELIARCFAPLAAPEGLGLTDDAASLPIIPDRTLVVTADAIVEGVHFFADDPPGLAARKLLRVNLSDLAAKGAVPAHYVLTVAFPNGVHDGEVMAFAGGLEIDQNLFGIRLLGGDTVSTPGPRCYSLTAFGWVAGAMLRRGGARPGDRLYVTGTIGDAGLGLRVLKKEMVGLSSRAALFAAHRYHLPEPRVALGPRLVGLATAALDVSDGLAADAGHMAAVSGVNIVIDGARVPLTDAVKEAMERGLMMLADVVSAGDDYEILFAAPPDRESEIMASAAEIGTRVTVIGEVRPGAGVDVLDRDGSPLSLRRPGFVHFGSA